MNIRRRTIFLSGPMQGIPDHNDPAFDRAARFLREQGHEVCNPAEFPHEGPLEDFPLAKAEADYAVFILTKADTIALLPGWGKSLGVARELALANERGLDVLHLSEWQISGGGE